MSRRNEPRRVATNDAVSADVAALIAQLAGREATRTEEEEQAVHDARLAVAELRAMVYAAGGDELDVPDAIDPDSPLARAGRRRRSDGEGGEVTRMRVHLRVERPWDMHENEAEENATNEQRAADLDLVRCLTCAIRVPADTAMAVTRCETRDATTHFCCIDCLARWAIPRAGLRLEGDERDAFTLVMDALRDDKLDQAQLRYARRYITQKLRP